MLLLFTGSEDGTSDLLVSKLGQERVFRFNYDLFKDYELKFLPGYWEITNPVGHKITSNTITSAFWWKAFNYYLLDQEKFIVEEVKYIFRELYHWCRLRGLTKGNPHDYHNHMGKMNILDIASKHLQTPTTLATFRLAGVNEVFVSKEVVAKSFSSGLTTTNKALFTTAVDKSKLHPDFPWYLQELIKSQADITVFICGQKLFSYRKSRDDLVGLDWRSEQTFDINKKEWIKFDLQVDHAQSIKSLCTDLKVDWGRLDFMESDQGMIFLEFNANGQWVFLDYFNNDGLLDAVCDYLMPSI